MTQFLDTLLTAERRKKLMKSIVNQCEKRQNNVDKLYKKIEKDKVSKKERDQVSIELEQLEEDQTKEVYLHAKYISALDGVLDEKKIFYLQEMRSKEEEMNNAIYRNSAVEIYRQIRNQGGVNEYNRHNVLDSLQSTVPQLEMKLMSRQMKAIASKEFKSTHWKGSPNEYYDPSLQIKLNSACGISEDTNKSASYIEKKDKDQYDIGAFQHKLYAPPINKRHTIIMQKL